MVDRQAGPGKVDRDLGLQRAVVRTQLGRGLAPAVIHQAEDADPVAGEHGLLNPLIVAFYFDDLRFGQEFIEQLEKRFQLEDVDETCEEIPDDLIESLSRIMRSLDHT